MELLWQALVAGQWIAVGVLFLAGVVALALAVYNVFSTLWR